MVISIFSNLTHESAIVFSSVNVVWRYRVILFINDISHNKSVISLTKVLEILNYLMCKILNWLRLRYWLWAWVYYETMPLLLPSLVHHWKLLLAVASPVALHLSPSHTNSMLMSYKNDIASIWESLEKNCKIFSFYRSFS